MMLHVPLAVVYAVFGIFMVAVIVTAAWRIWRLCGRSWRETL